MARWTEKFWGGRWWGREEWDAMVAAQQASVRSGPNIISDTMAPIVSMADGQTYDSKSRYQRSVRAAGCEIVGNDIGAMKHRPIELPSVGPDMRRALQDLQSR